MNEVAQETSLPTRRAPVGLVLVGTALDPASDDVVRLGLELARRAGCRVALVHALPTDLVAGSVGMGFPDAGILVAEERDRREALERQAQRVGIAAAELAGVHLQLGAPHRVLLDVAERLSPDLVVVGATAGGWGRRLLGSTAERLIRLAAFPVLVLRGQPVFPPETVLLGVDLSPVSADAMRRGLSVLRYLAPEKPPKVEALFVMSPLQRSLGHPFTPDQIDRFAGEELERFIAQNSVGYPVAVAPRLRLGDPRDEIVKEIGVTGAGMVVVGTHGASGFERFVLGSVAAEVLRGAPCSVLVVPPTAIARAEDAERRRAAERTMVPPVV